MSIALNANTVGGSSGGGGDNGGSAQLSSAVDVILTLDSSRVQSVDMTTVGKSVFLPDATTLTTGGELFAITATNKAFSLRDSAGTILGSVAVSQTIILYLVNNSTAAGVWRAGVLQPPAAIPVNGTPTAINTETSYAMKLSRLSDTAAITIYSGTSGYPRVAVVTVSGVTPTMGAAVTVEAYSTSAFAVTALSETKAICTFKGTGGTLRAAVLDISGTAITVGTIVDVDPLTSPQVSSLSAVSATQALCAYVNGLNLYAVSLDISGSTITVGTKTSALDTNAGSCAIVVLSSTKAILSYNSTYVRAHVITISGSTLSAGLQGAVVSHSSGNHSLCRVNDTRAICTYSKDSTEVYAVLLEASGTVIANGTPVLLGYGTTTGVAAFTPTTFVCTYYRSAILLVRETTFTLADTTITVAASADIMSGSSGGSGIAALTSTKALFGYQSPTTVYYGALVSEVATL